MSAQKRHLSPSAIDTFLKCPEAWRRRYIEGDVIPPSAAAHRGTGLHGAARVNFRQKIESHADLPAKDLVDAAVATFEEELRGKGLQLNSDEASRGATIIIAEAKDECATLAEAFAKSVAPVYQPVMVEEPVRIHVPSGEFDLFGVLDLIDDQSRVTDFKTSSKKKSQSDADRNTGLTFYAAAGTGLLGHSVSEVRLDTLVSKKGGVERQVLVSHRGRPHFAALSATVNTITLAVQSGIFAPASALGWWCNEKWCGYWHTCPYVARDSERREAGRS